MEKRTQQSSPCLKIVLYGPESTGKTTLAKALADHYQTTWVPEFARNFLQEKWDKYQEKCTLEDLHTIAQGQLAEENAQVKKQTTLLFCDTNILVTKVWSETHFEGYCAPELNAILAEHPLRLLFVDRYRCSLGKDDFVTAHNNVKSMLAYFKAQLEHYNFPYLQLSGTLEERLIQATTLLDDLIHQQQPKKTNKSYFCLAQRGALNKELRSYPMNLGG